MITIAIVDDKYLNRNDRKLELEYHGKIKVLFTAQNGLEFLEKMKLLGKQNLPEIVLMDIDMPEKNGIETVREAKVIYPEVEFLMLTVFDEYDKIFEAIKAGASGYILKDESTDTIINYIEQVMEFKTVPMSPSVARKALKLLANEYTFEKSESGSLFNLTPRETEVLRGMVKGLDYKEIAESLVVSPYTVRNQITSIYRKLHVSSKSDAVKIALRNNMI